MLLPLGFYGQIAPRSGLTVKHFTDVGANNITIAKNTLYKNKFNIF